MVAQFSLLKTVFFVKCEDMDSVKCLLLSKAFFFFLSQYCWFFHLLMSTLKGLYRAKSTLLSF